MSYDAFYRPSASRLSGKIGTAAANQIEQNQRDNFCGICDAPTTQACRMCSEKFCGQHVYESESGEKLCGECVSYIAAQVPEQADPSTHPYFAGYR